MKRGRDGDFPGEGTLCSKARRQPQGRVGGGAGNLVPVEPRLKMRLSPKDSVSRLESVDFNLRVVGSLEGVLRNGEIPQTAG